MRPGSARRLTERAHNSHSHHQMHARALEFSSSRAPLQCSARAASCCSAPGRIARPHHWVASDSSVATAARRLPSPDEDKSASRVLRDQFIHNPRSMPSADYTRPPGTTLPPIGLPNLRAVRRRVLQNLARASEAARARAFDRGGAFPFARRRRPVGSMPPLLR